MLVIEQKLFTLKDIDECIEGLNLRLFDGDKPSLSGVSLASLDSNLQHGTISYIFCMLKPFD